MPEIPDMIDVPQAGEKWRHFRGTEYEIVCLAKDSEGGCLMVVYQGADLIDRWVRPLEMWSEMVEHEGQQVRRFTKISDS